MQPAPVQHLHRGLEALALDPADQVFRRHPGILEDHVGDLRALLAHFLFRLADAHARRARLDHKGGYPAGPLDLRVGAGHHGENAGGRGIGDIALGAVQHIVVAVAPGRGLQGGGIGTRLRLGQAEGRGQVAAGQFRQIFRLLIRRAVDDQALRADADIGAKGRAESGGGLAEGEHHLDLVGHGEAETAIFLRDRQAIEAKLAHFRQKLGRHRIVIRHPGLGRAQAFADETGQGFDELVASLPVEGHRCLSPFFLSEAE